jgi:hypothetical protein
MTLQTFEVYHLNAELFRHAYSKDLDKLAPFPGPGYTLVARVTAPTLGHVFQLTNTIDHPWWWNKGVEYKAPNPDGCRSTSVGDVVVDEQGQACRCLCAGWSTL